MRFSCDSAKLLHLLLEFRIKDNFLFVRNLFMFNCDNFRLFLKSWFFMQNLDGFFNNRLSLNRVSNGRLLLLWILSNNQFFIWNNDLFHFLFFRSFLTSSTVFFSLFSVFCILNLLFLAILDLLSLSLKLQSQFSSFFSNFFLIFLQLFNGLSIFSDALVDRFILLFEIFQLSLEFFFLSLSWCELLLSIPEWLPGCFDLELTI